MEGQQGVTLLWSHRDLRHHQDSLGETKECQEPFTVRYTVGTQ